MKHTLRFSADLVRARVKALSALQNMIDDCQTLPLNADANPALNQTIVFAFTHALMHLVPYVTAFNIEPEDFYANPADLVMLDATVEVPSGADITWPVVVKMMEEFMANKVLAEILPSTHSAVATFKALSDDTLTHLRDFLESGTTLPRLRRSH